MNIIKICFCNYETEFHASGISLFFSYMVVMMQFDLLRLQAGTEPGHCPGRSEAGQRPDPLLLKPEQDFLHFNIPSKWKSKPQ